MNSLDLCHVLQLHIQRLREQHTESTSRQGDDAVDDHGDGVMVGAEQADERSQDPGHSGTHGVQTHAVLSADVNRTENKNLCCDPDLHPAPSDLPEGGGVEFRRVDVDGGEASSGRKLSDHGDDRDHNGKI